jgi:hypothetical protein
MVREHEGVFEARACPLDIPEPRDTTLTQPLYSAQLSAMPGVDYTSSASHFSLVRIGGSRGTALLDYTIVREDGATPYTRRFELSRDASP